jgi:hypothetical protein
VAAAVNRGREGNRREPGASFAILEVGGKSRGEARPRASDVFSMMTLVTIMAVIFVDSASSQVPKQKKFTKRDGDIAKKNKTIGYIWDYRGFTVVDDKPTGEKIDGRLRVFNYEDFLGPRKIGYVKPNGPLESTLTVTDMPALNGTVTLKKIGMRPEVWAGLLVKDDGSKRKLTVGFLQN